MFVTFINDSKDENAQARMSTRMASVLELPVQTVGVESDLEAAGNLIDMLDAAQRQTGAVVVSVAPRQGDNRKPYNGSPFGYFFYGDTLVLTTIDGLTLSLVKKLKLTPAISLIDISEVLNKLGNKYLVSDSQAENIKRSQFRSFELLPMLTKWLLAGEDVPGKEYSLENVLNATYMVWWIDNFGNLKTTVLASDLLFEPGKTIDSRLGQFMCYETLHEVPDHQIGLIVGSSGIEDKRFLEIVKQGGNAAWELNAVSGRKVF